MCNEIEDQKVAQYRLTITDVDDPDQVEVSMHPTEPVWDENDLIFGTAKRAELLREGIEIELYGEFYCDCWRSPGGATRMEYRPLVRRELTQAEYDEIASEMRAAFPDLGSDEVEY